MTGIGATDDVDEHPIIFNEWSINRIRTGKKTQTRRIVSDYDQMLDLNGGRWPSYEDKYGEVHMKSCPYGESGSVLWVREAFRLPHTYDEFSPNDYVEEGPPCLVRWEADEGDYNTVPKDGWGRKRPSIHMPYELHRIRLRVEDVRVGRVQEIGELGAFREGLVYEEGYGWNAPDHSSIWYQSHKGCFADLWEDIHGDGAWDENPWVWVVKFSETDEN